VIRPSHEVIDTRVDTPNRDAEYGELLAWRKSEIGRRRTKSKFRRWHLYREVWRGGERENGAVETGVETTRARGSSRRARRGTPPRRSQTRFDLTMSPTRVVLIREHLGITLARSRSHCPNVLLVFLITSSATVVVVVIGVSCVCCVCCVCCLIFFRELYFVV